eukprot:SAG31_NODE_1517_length_8031_cov_18.008699_2_plen_190_part_00
MHLIRISSLLSCLASLAVTNARAQQTCVVCEAGSNAVASGDRATAFGAFTTAGGDGSTAMGLSSAATGRRSTAIGDSTRATGRESTAMGFRSLASGSQSLAVNSNTIAIGTGATAMGGATEASGVLDSLPQLFLQLVINILVINILVIYNKLQVACYKYSCNLLLVGAAKNLTEVRKRARVPLVQRISL